MKKKNDELRREFKNENEAVQNEFENYKKRQMKEVEKFNKTFENNDDDIFELNVGGTLFTVTRKTLCRAPGTMIEAKFSGRHPIKLTKDGKVFIDRNPKAFEYVIEYLRNYPLKPEVDDPEK